MSEELRKEILGILSPIYEGMGLEDIESELNAVVAKDGEYVINKLLALVEREKAKAFRDGYHQGMADAQLERPKIVDRFPGAEPKTALEVLLEDEEPE